jgi:hypothetical protein
MRCPQCLAVVRLHVNTPGKSHAPSNRPPANAFDVSSFAAAHFRDVSENAAKNAGFP